MSTSPIYKLVLHKTYYEMGFFNLGVEVDRFVRTDDGAITLVLGASGTTVVAHVNRSANQNNTPRIMGGAELRNWFHSHYKQGDAVQVTILAADKLRLD